MTTEYVSIDRLDTAREQADIARAGKLIRDGGLVIFPTETVYGLGGDATSNDAAHAIYAAKGRPADNPLIIHIANPEDAARYTYTCQMYEKLAKAFMPGPLTVILPSRPIIPPSVRAGLDTVAVRCPSHPVAHALICAAGVPIAAPSANLSGKPSPTCAAHVRDDMDGRVHMIIDGGDCEVGLESTIVKIEDDGSLLLLRPGGITLSDLKSVTENIRVAPAVTAKLAEGEKVLSPGMKYRHYAPSAPVFLLDGDFAARLHYLKDVKGHCALLCHTEEAEAFSSLFPTCDIYLLGSREDLSSQAHRLFFLLREADKANYDAIYAPLPNKDGIGLALYNRMIRAAAYQIIHLS
jgi:L-threonylcarbamoyladenylate synthase